MANKAGMASGVEVARISVKVSPDTRQFRRELQAELDAIERSVKGKVKVEAVAQTAKAETQLNNAARTRTAELKVDVDQGLLQSYAKLTERLKGNISPGLKGEMFARQIDGMVAAFNKKYPLGVKLNPSDVREVIAEIAALKKLMVEGDSSLGVIPDREMSKRQEMLRQLDELTKIRLTVDDGDLKAKVDRLKAELAKPIPLGISAEDRIARSRIEAQFNALRDELSNKKIKVEVDKNNLVKSAAEAVGEAVETAAKVAGAGAKGIGDAISAATGSLGAGGGGKSKLWPKFGTGLNASAIGIVIAGALALIGPLIGVISTSLLALPGLISLMLAPIAAVTLGLDGFKKAAEKIKPQFEELQKTMNEASETAFTPVLQRVADEIFPRLRAELPKVTAGLGQLSQGILDGLAGPRFENIIARIGDAFAALRPGVASFTSGFTGLVDQFTQKLPGITQWINEAGAGFDKWVTKVSADGTLQSALSNLGTTISQITSSLTNIGKAGVEFMADPKNMELALDAVKGIEVTMVKLVELSGDISQKWSQIKDVFSSIANSPLGDMAKALTDWSGEGDKAYEDQSVGFKIAGPLGNQIQKAFQAGLGNEDAKKYMEQFFGDVEQQSGQAGYNAGKAFATNAKNQIAAAASGQSAYRSGATEAGGEGQPKIEPPNTEEAKAKLQEYDQFVTDVSNRVKESMSKVTEGDTLPPPNLDAFKQAWNELPGFISQAMMSATNAALAGVNGIVAALNGGTQAILGIVTSWPAMITAALSSMQAVGFAAGMQLAAGMAAGIAAGQGSVIAAAVAMATAAEAAAKGALGIKSPSRVFMKIGKNTAEGLGVGLENGLEPVIAQAKQMAWKISDVFSKNGDPTSLLDGFTNKEVSRMEKVLAFESKRLGMQAKALDYQSKVTGNSALKAQADGIRLKKEELDLQKEMLDLTQEYSELNEADKFSESPLGKAVQDLMGMPQDFVRATGQQFLSDIGIDGGGALGAIADYGMSMANKYVFNVSNVDEAMAVHQNQVSKQALGIGGR